MLSVFKSIDRRLVEMNEIEPGCWVKLTSPTDEEIERVCNALDVDPALMRAALDEEETSHIDFAEGQTLIVIDVPIVEDGDDNTLVFSTLPIGIIVTGSNVITVSLKENTTLQDISGNVVKNISPALKTQFVLHILLRAAKRYLYYLRQIDKISVFVEKQLHKSMKNKELFQLLELEKSLVYLSTSLRSNDITMKKIATGKIVKLYEEDQDLMDDVMIEINQAIEMASIYSGILSGTMDAFASVISNNLNIVMKKLTSVTILLTIPNIVFGFYGMNVEHLPLPVAWFPFVITLVFIAISAMVLKKRDLF
ncbi:MAG: magnesium transporter CorA family protein [Clostridiales bacterium]|nr:magnesium transporter CorA family protein [Clostridiales bacterium]